MNDAPTRREQTGTKLSVVNLLALLSIIAVAALVFAICGEAGLGAVGTVSGSLFAAWHHTRR